MFGLKKDDHSLIKFYSSAAYALMFLLFCRLISMCFIPLNDSTEARYGEIARKMLETGNWVTPLNDYGDPFWAKPPLSTWLSAFSMKLFGVNEFAARLPGLLLSIAVLWLIWDLAKKHSGSVVALLSLLVLSGTLSFFLDAGTVMTDPSLLFCTTLSLVAFWHAFVAGSKSWSFVFFVGLGLGLLAKGPVAVVLVGMPVFFWILIRNEWLNLWKKLPWITGTLLTAAIALPWYILAEIRTPGFLNYFIIGENISRFLKPGWSGDKYGIAHHQPWGMIWIYALAGTIPWSILGCSWLLKHWKKIPSYNDGGDGWMSYLFFCMIIPLLFFTFSSNIIYPYVFPSLPAFALLFAELWDRSSRTQANRQLIVSLSLTPGIIFLVATIAFQLMPRWVAKTQKPLVNTWLQQKPAAGSNLVYWDDRPSYSAQFYSSGKAKSTKDIATLCALLSNKLDNYLVINSNDVSEIPIEIYSKCNVVDKLLIRHMTHLLVHCPELNCKRELVSH